MVAAVSRDDTAQHVVAVAAREAAERHTPLLIVHAIPMQDAAQFQAEHDWIAAVVAGAGVPSWLPHRTVVTVADPTAAVLDRVEPDDLLVVATRGEGRLAGLVAGSVTRALLDAGPCDVLVVSHGATHPTSGLTSPPAQVRTPTNIVTLTDTECWSLLRSAAVGRLGVTVKGRPDIFPVNHVVHRESIVFRTSQGSKLDACVDQPVAYEVDGFDTATGDAWSVVIKGTAKELRERDEIMRALRLPITPWPGDPKPRIVQINPDPGPGSVTGRRFHVFGGITTVTSSPTQGWLTAPGPDGAIPAASAPSSRAPGSTPSHPLHTRESSLGRQPSSPRPSTTSDPPAPRPDTAPAPGPSAGLRRESVLGGPTASEWLAGAWGWCFGERVHCWRLGYTCMSVVEVDGVDRAVGVGAAVVRQ